MRTIYYSLYFILILGFELYAAVPLVQIGQGPEPVIDGQLNDAGWQHCAQITPFLENMGNGLAKAQTKVKVFYNTENLYVAFICDEPFVEKLVADRTMRDRGVWQDDCVEIWLQIPGDISIYHILLNSNGLSSDSRFSNYGWDPQLDVVTFKNKEQQKWGVELAIPWSEFGTMPKIGDSWSINFTRQRKVEMERSAWNATYGTFTNATRFGRIVFESKPVIQHELHVFKPVPGYNSAMVQLELPDNNAGTLYGAGGPSYEINPGSKKPVDFGYPLGLADTEVILTAEMSGRPVWRRVFPGNIGDTPALEKLQHVIAALKDTPDILTEDNPLKQTLQTALASARDSEAMLTEAISQSIKQKKSLSLEQYRLLNKKVQDEEIKLNQKKWILWSKNNWANVGRHEFPEQFEDISTIKITSLLNEYEQSNVIITNLTNKPLRLRASSSDFTWIADNGDKIKFAGVSPELFLADWQEVVTGKTIADPLLPLGIAGRLDIPVGESRQLWITTHAQDLPPGTYECELNLKPLGTHEMKAVARGKNVKIQLLVQPLRISTSPDFAVYNWDYANEESYVQDLVNHKVNFFLINTNIPAPEFDKNGNPKGEIDYSAYDRMLRIKQKYAKKAHGQILFSYGLLESFHTNRGKKYGFEYRDAAWDKAFKYTYTNWLNHLKELGFTYDDFCVQVWDEALEEELDYTIKGCKLLREIDPKVRLVMDGTQKENEVKRLDPYIDVWIPSLDELQNSKNRENLLKTYKSLGEPVYCYTCNINMKSQPPYDYHLLKPWKAANLGLDGVFYWAYNSWRGDPWNDYDGPISNGTFYADCGVIYNGAHAPVTSRRWEASRQGIEDWQIIRLTQKLAQDSDQKQIILKQIQNEIKQVADSPLDLDLAQSARLKLIETAVDLAKEKPLQIMDIKSNCENQKLTVLFKTSSNSSAKLLYRLVGTENWQSYDCPAAKSHSAHVALPPVSKAEWMILAWDNLGKVTYAKGKH